MSSHSGEIADTATGVPILINKLCSLFAKDDQELRAKLFKMSMSFLTSPQNAADPRDEAHIVAQIKKHINENISGEKQQEFDLIYAQIQKSNVLKHRNNVLTFLLALSKATSVLELNKSSDQNETHTTNASTSLMANSSSKSHFNFLPDDPSVGVKKIYQANLGRHLSLISTRTHITGSSSCDQDFVKDRLSSMASSFKTVSSIASVTEEQLLEEIIYSFQGIEGKIIRKEPGTSGFMIDPKMGKNVSPNHRSLVERLTGLGFLHNQLKQHCDEADKQIGLIGQALVTSLRDELVDYYQLVALLQTQLRPHGMAAMEQTHLTLRRLVVWVAEPQFQLQWLAHIAEECSDKKGGALITEVHGFLLHGAKRVQKVAEKVLTAVCRPLYIMLSNWLLNGTINDPCGEFFIEARNINSAERLWHDKYHVRKAMIPSFISLDHTNKILATGKSINFLRQICKDHEELPGRDSLQKSLKLVDSFFSPERSLELHSALESVYIETSHRVLDLLRNKYRLLEHLQALRRYLLLGQGDFIRHLLELLAPELSRPAEVLYGHTLSAILESAIRVTNAQYEDEDTLKRLHANLMSNSRDDIGWDVFTLDYVTDGPIGTIFRPTVSIYKSLFGGLWKAKRMEFVLSNMRKQQITCSKTVRRIRELQPVNHTIYVLCSEMIHFLHQTQYYFLFEVLECSWAEMLRQVNQAVCLDDVIVAHNTFLESVQSGVLLNIGSDPLRSQLRSIFIIILNLESVQDTLYKAAIEEHTARVAYERKINSTKDFGLTESVAVENSDRLAAFGRFLTTVKAEVSALSTSYKNMVEKYLNLLSANPNMNLQLLSTRLNFNDFYNRS